MCGIIFLANVKNPEIIEEIKQCFRHRGPDDDQAMVFEKPNGRYDVVYFTRLAIKETSKGGLQPYTQNDIVTVTNGEIYNYTELEKTYGTDDHKSDTHVVGKVFEKEGEKAFHIIRGMWATVVYNKKTGHFFVAKDHLGIIPLYVGHGPDGEFYASSELKTIHSLCESLESLQPGHLIESTDLKKRKWYDPSWHHPEAGIPTKNVEISEIHDQLYKVVEEEMMGDVPFGILISGGVDSSIIAAIVMDLYKKGKIDLQSRGMSDIHSFTIGLEGSPDLMNAKVVAEMLGTKHHSFTFTVEEGYQAMKDVVFHTETFNQTTIRASTPLFLMCKKIHEMGIRVIYSGEGADEMFGGYLYFHHAPNPEEMQKELVRKMNRLYMYDLLRTNKSCMGHSIELRPPFLNKAFVEFVMNINPAMKMADFNPEMKMEKYILRKAFENYLPASIIWRQKEQFSDGVGYKWIDYIKEMAEKTVSDEDFANAATLYPQATPFDKEMMMQRRTFDSHFKTSVAVSTVPYGKSVACSTPEALEWSASLKNMIDESGRAIACHKDAY